MPLTEALPNGATPWFDSAWKKFGVNLPLVLDGSKGLPVEELAGMGPDVILAANSRLTRSQYEELSRIAPVIASPDALSSTDWRSSLALVGKAIGRSTIADEVRLATESSITSELHNYPALAGTSFIAVKVRSAVGADFEVMGERSGAARMLEEWGLRLSPVLTRISQDGRALDSDAFGATSYSWPQDRGGELESEIAVISALHRETGQLEKEVLESVPAYGKGNYLMVDDRDGALALDTGSCLSAQWLSRTMLPQVAKTAFRARQGA